MDFVHLHNHSDYSLLDGAQTVQSLVRRVKELGMSAVALTEHGNLFSAVNFYSIALKEGVKPIIGCEMYVSQGSRFDRKTREQGGGYYHLLLLAKNNTGFKNLIKLVSKAYTEGFYHRPRIDWELLTKYHEGLIATSACIKGKVPDLAIRGEFEKALQAAREFAELFEGHFYLEVQNHQLPEELQWYQAARRISAMTGIPCVLTNDTHYTLPEHWEAHDVHLCIGTGKDLQDPNRLRYEPHEYWVKSPAEMAQLFPDAPDLLENTVRIAEQCEIAIDCQHHYLPEFPLPEEAGVATADDYLSQLVENGIRERYPEVTAEIRQRVDYELSVIKRMGFAGYFLIVRDFVNFARRNNIAVGPGRGSAAGSIVAYALGITNVEPLRYKLLFERFLNPERISMPDIDIDFADIKRDQVIDYIKQRFGANSVAQIIAFGKMKARAVIRDVGRVLGMPLAEVNRIAKMISEQADTNLADCLANSVELQQAAKIDEQHRKLFEISLVLEGMNRHASTHAAGVVIAPGELTDYLPLYLQAGSGDISTQYDMKCVDMIGLLKVDLLGIRTLTVIEDTLTLLRAKGIDIDITKIPTQDELTLKLFGDGNTIGVFQFESKGMREYLKKLKPTGIDDLIAMNALYRPGPMQMIDEYIERKHGRKPIEYLHPSLEPILADTYGIIVYQEQVMQIAHRVAGFSLAKADHMRKAMGKKLKAEMEKMNSEFVNGAVKNGIEKKTAQEIFEVIDKFASYGFNRSHAVAYAILAYQCGYLKAHYPAEFIAANLTSEINRPDRIPILANDARNLGLEILPPDVNASEVTFTAEGKTIRYGLNAIKNVGEKAAENIVAARRTKGPFQTFFQFVAALDLKCVNRKVLECLIASGATDSLEGTRGQKFAALDRAIQYAQRLQEEQNNHQASLFGLNATNQEGNGLEPRLPDVPPWDNHQKWTREKELLGMYLSGHPLLEYSTEIEAFSNYDFTEPLGELDGKILKIGGLIENIKVQPDKKGRPFAFLTLESLNGRAEVIAFSDLYARTREHIVENKAIFVQGKVSARSENDAKIIAEEISPLQGLLQRKSKRLHIRLDANKHAVETLANLKTLLSNYAGESVLLLHLCDADGNSRVIRSNNLRVSAERELLDTLRKTFGAENVWVES
jgi:DNA polymerase-3 subunit alpha